MILKRIPVGSYMANCYIFGDSDTNEVVIIDPGDEAGKIIDFIKNENYIVKYIAFTHSHFDHVGALEKVKEEFDVPVISDVESFYTGKHKIDVIKTPGHTSDGVCYYCENILFSGDTLFNMSVGRTDMPTGDFEQLKSSILNLYQLPDETVVYPGHGLRTTIGRERKNNPYVRG